MNNLKQRYLKLYPKRAVPKDDILLIETTLDIILPNDMKNILEFYDGFYDIASFSLYDFIIDDTDWNIMSKTLEYRNTITLPNNYLVLKECDESFIVLDTLKKIKNVIWISDVDALNLSRDYVLLDNPIFFNSYTNFFEYLLNQEEKIRKDAL